MTKKTLSIYNNLAILFTALVITLSSKGFSQDPNFYIFIAFGQSNMEGNISAPDNQLEKGDTTNIPARFQLLPAVDWPNGSKKKGVWTAAKPPLCRNTTGLCPCDYFGRRLVDSLPQNVKIGIINVSVAGCQIECFDKDKYQSYLALSSTASWLRDIAKLYGGNPYARLVEMGLAAQKDGVIKGFLLHQGESGTMTGKWATEVQKIYFDLIKDLSLDSNKVPILAGGLTGDNNNTGLPWDLNKSPKLIKNSYVVSSKGCASSAGSNSVHFSGAGYRELGKRYGDSMLVALRKLGTGPTSVSDNKIIIDNNSSNRIDFKNGTISFEIPQNSHVSLKAYTLGGREIAEITNTEYAKGRHSLNVNMKKITAGACILKMNTGSFSVSQKVFASAQ